MSPAKLVCRDCGAGIPVTGEVVDCPECGTTYEGLEGLAGGYSGQDGKRRESDVQREIVAALERLGFHVTKLDQGYRRDGSTRQTAGVPDLWAMSPKHQVALWVEVKGPNTPVRKSQEAWHGIAKASGVYVTVARSSTDVAEYLQEIGVPIQVEGAA